MKITLSLDIDDMPIANRADMSSLIRLVACDIEQGSSDGHIRNNKTGNESNRWSLQIANVK